MSSMVECRTPVIVAYTLCRCVSSPLSPACVFSGLSVSSRWTELVGLALLRSSCWWSPELRPFSYSWLSPCRRCQVRPNRWTATHAHKGREKEIEEISIQVIQWVCLSHLERLSQSSHSACVFNSTQTSHRTISKHTRNPSTHTLSHTYIRLMCIHMHIGTQNVAEVGN